MKMVDVSYSQNITILPSKYTLAAIKRIAAGDVIQESTKQRVRDIFRISHLNQLKALLKHIQEMEVEVKKAEKRTNLVASSDKLDLNIYLLDKKFKAREKTALSLLNPKEIYLYTVNLIGLSEGLKIKDKFHDHHLKDYSLSSGINIRYSQNLQGFRSFCLRTDVGFKKRLAKDPEAQSKAIICLYKPKTANNKITLYNIGLHDFVYNTDISEYEIIPPNR